MLKIQDLCLKIVLFVSLFAIHYSLLTVSYAAHPLITDDTGTQGKGKFQLEITGEYSHKKEGGTKEDSSEIAAALSYGAADTVDIVLGVPHQLLRVKEGGSTVLREYGLSDVSLELKWRFFEYEKFSLALKPGLSLPSGEAEKGLGADKVNFSGFLIATWDNDPLAVYANLGYIRNENDSGAWKDLWHASMAASYGVADKLYLVGNIGIERNADRNAGTHPAFVLAGMIYAVSENFDIDFGVKGGLNRPEADYSILAGIAWRF